MVKLCRKHYIILLRWTQDATTGFIFFNLSADGSLKAVHSRPWLNPGCVVSPHDIALLFAMLHLKVDTIANALSRFRAAGVEPFDSLILTFTQICSFNPLIELKQQCQCWMSLFLNHLKVAKAVIIEPAPRVLKNFERPDLMKMKFSSNHKELSSQTSTIPQHRLQKIC